MFLSSDSRSSSDSLRSLSSRETESGIRGSPGLLVSIQALIFGNLNETVSTCVTGLKQDGPFIPFPDVILFAEVYQVCDGFCGEELKGIDDIDLRTRQIPGLNGGYVWEAVEHFPRARKTRIPGADIALG